MLHFGALVVYELIRDPPVKHGYSKKRTPKVVGLVVYSGKRKWTPPLDPAECMGVSTAEHRRAVPTFEYRVVDLQRIVLPGSGGNLAVRLQRMQACESPEKLWDAAWPLRGLGVPDGTEEEKDLASVFASWITTVLVPALGVEHMPASDNLKQVLDLLESQGMNWAERMREEGRLKGVREVLMDIARERFDAPVTDKLAQRLESITDPNALRAVRKVLQADVSPDTLLARVGRL